MFRFRSSVGSSRAIKHIISSSSSSICRGTLSSPITPSSLFRRFATQPKPIPTSWNTKIVCTIGPSSSNVETLEQMILSGMDFCRLNFSHGRYDEHQSTFDTIRQLGMKYDNQIGILCDIQGPKIRTGKMEEPFEVNVGDKIRVTPDDVSGTPDLIKISYDTLVQDLDKGDTIFINDGTVKLEVEGKDTENNQLLCEVKTAGKISDNKGCNMPSGRLSVNVVTEKDAADLDYIAKNLDPEYVAASFIGCGRLDKYEIVHF